MDAKTFLIRKRFKDDFEYYAPRALKIRPQEGGLVPFILTEQQKKLHAVAERQLATRGRVRIIVGKGRKTKTSTYVQGRFFWKVTHRKGVKAYVAAHDSDTTEELFGMADRFYRYCPEALRPQADTNSVRSLSFEGIDTGYSVGTAGSLNIGRGFTIQMLHLSEVAYYPEAEEIARGLMSAVADTSGTEIWVESTGNGPGDWFHSQVMSAIRGESDYEFVFLEWWLEPMYASDEPVTPDEDEQKLLAQCKGMTVRNLAWRRKRIAQYGGGKSGLALFRREFPCSVSDIFSGSDDAWIPPDLVEAAAKRDPLDCADGPVVVGIDPGGGGEDPTALVARRGSRQFYHHILKEKEPEAVVGRLKVLLRELCPKAIFVDTIGVGHHLVAQLSAEFPGVRGVDFRRTAIESDRYANKRAECYGNLKEWLATASIEDAEELKIELSVFHYRYRVNGQLEMETKEKARERGNKSPNLADCLAISQAEPVEHGLLDNDRWNTWPLKPKADNPHAEDLPKCNFITAYAWLSDEQWCVAAVGVFLPDIDKQRIAGQKHQLANAIVLKCIDGDGIYHFLDSADKLWKQYKPDYFYVPARASIVIKDLRVKNLMIRRAKFETVQDVVAVAADVLKNKVGWVRNTSQGAKLKGRLARYPHGNDEALYGCIGLAIAHLRQRGNLAVQWADEEAEIPRTTRSRDDAPHRRTAY